MDKIIPAKVAVRSSWLRWLSVACCLTLVANVAVTVHLIPYPFDHGFGSAFAAAAAGAVGIMALPGRLVFTPLGGRIPRRFVAAAIFLLQSLAVIALITLNSTVEVVIFVVLFWILMLISLPAVIAILMIERKPCPRQSPIH